jgi:hypothetical protein
MMDFIGLHSAATTVYLLNSWSWDNLSDLAPLDFHLSSKIKEYLRGQCFHSSQDVQNKVKMRLHAQDAFFL